MAIILAVSVAHAAEQNGPHYRTDDPSPEKAVADRPSTKTVGRWREHYLHDWQKRMDRALKAR